MGGGITRNKPPNPDGTEGFAVLVLGSVGAGKTLLVRRMKQMADQGRLDYDGGAEEHTIPTVLAATVGQDLQRITIKNTGGTKVTTPFREIGGALSQRWASYVVNCTVLLFVVDASNLQKAAASWVDLLDLLALPGLQHKPVIVCLNKLDVCNRAEYLAEIYGIMRLGEVMASWDGGMNVMSVSALTGEGVPALLQEAASAHRRGLDVMKQRLNEAQQNKQKDMKIPESAAALA